MRAIRETELLDEFPMKDDCGWIGNSQAIAMKHYAMRREDSFARTSGMAPVGAHNGVLKTCLSEAVAGISDEVERVSKVGLNQENHCKKEPQAAQGRLGQNDDNGRRGTRTPDIYFVRVAL